MSGCSWERSKSLLDNAQADAEIRKPPSGHLPDRFLKIRFGIAFRHNLGRFQPVRLGAIQKSAESDSEATPRAPRTIRPNSIRTDPPSSTVRGQKQRFSEGAPRNHAGFRAFSVKGV
jgi:hypothetical protein